MIINYTIIIFLSSLIMPIIGGYELAGGLAAGLTWGLAGCGQKSSSNYKITIRNDILDKDFNTVLIEGIITSRGISSIKKSLNPGEEFNIPSNEISKITLSRKYPDHVKMYEVSCPSTLKTEVTMKLIDIHTNRLSGGCKLTKRGQKQASGVTKWD